ncbi:hypothetical protein ABBQ32_14155 [Trebouxia sp. C0010 RCD-2024]
MAMSVVVVVVVAMAVGMPTAASMGGVAMMLTPRARGLGAVVRGNAGAGGSGGGGGGGVYITPEEMNKKQRLVAFHSYKFGSAELNYPTGEKELLAVITALRQWRCHLEGAGKVVVVTDHKPNTFLDRKPYVQLSSRQVHWQQFLSRFDFTWEYCKGCANVADPVSRNPALLNAVIALSPVGSEGVPGSLLQRIRDGYASDKWFDNAKHTEQLTFADGVWSKDNLVVVPDVDDLRQRCLSLHHDTPFAGHLGHDRTVQLVQQCFWWPGLDGDVRRYVSTCDHCQRNKSSNEKPAGLLQPLPVPEFRWQRVTVDFIQDLPETKAGHTAVAVFVDRLSKMVHFAPAWNNMGAEEFAQILMTNIFRLHGVPVFLVSDRDKLLTSKFFARVSELLGVEQRMSTASHPQTDGQTERANKTLEDMLRHFVNPAQTDWDVKLACCEFAVNIAWNRATGSTPFFLNYGDHPRTPVNVDVVTPLPAANAFVGRVRMQSAVHVTLCCMLSVG